MCALVCASVGVHVCVPVYVCVRLCVWRRVSECERVGGWGRKLVEGGAEEPSCCSSEEQRR